MTRCWSGQRKSGIDCAAVEVDRDVDVRWLEPRIEEEIEDGVLEFASGGGVAGGEDLGEVGDAGAGAEVVEGVEDLGDGHEVALGFADGASERAVVELAGEVDQGAGGGGDRDALVVGGVRDRRAVDADACVASLGGDRDLRVAIVPAHEAVQGGGREVAEVRGGAAGLHGGQERALQCEFGVAHGVNPAVKGVEMPAAYARFDRVATQAARAQFIERQHAPLLCREPRNQDIRSIGHFVGLRSTK